MIRRFTFQKAKFLALPHAQQHKKCAEFLTEILQGRSELVSAYQELLSWMNEPAPALSTDYKTLLDLRLFHEKRAGITRSEHGLTILQHDRMDAAQYLPISIYLENLRSAHNIGSIVRTTEALRLGSICFSKEMIAPTHEKLQKSAMGTQHWVHCSRPESLSALPRPLIVLETIAESTPYYDVDFPKRFTLAVGNEEYGCSDELLQAADMHIHIPMHGRKNSLNVASAFAIVAAKIREKIIAI